MWKGRNLSISHLPVLCREVCALFSCLKEVAATEHSCLFQSATSDFVPAEVKYFPTAGFNISFIPQGTEREFGHSVLPPLVGFYLHLINDCTHNPSVCLTFLALEVMIQFVRPTQMITLDIRCRIHASNQDKLDAIKEVEFNFKQTSSPLDASEWDYDA